MKILVIRFSSIGDIVLTSPVVRCLKLQLAAEVHFLTKERYRDLVVANPHIDKVFLIEDAISPAMTDLHRERYDYIIDLHKNLRTLVLRLGLRRRFKSFNKLNFRKWLLVNAKVNQMPDRHIVDRYLGAVRSLGVQNDGKGLDFFIPKGQEVKLAKEWKYLRKNKQSPFVVFAIGAAHATKRLPEDQIRTLCQSLDLPIVLLGGPAESAVGERLASELGAAVFNACGRWRLGQSASIIQQATVVISHDTGMMHIAAAFRKPLISIWGSTVPAFGMYPYVPEAVDSFEIHEVKGLRCRPCSKIGHDRCPKGHFQCMKNQSMEKLAGSVRKKWSVANGF
ncbi:MAG: glycosyltransferase family 9 protein [Bacteroidota bacterium]